jgi:NADH-quinone oxidoreductase subunit E
MAFVLSEAQERELTDILSRYPNKMAACIPVLHLCQNANQNWVSPEVIQFVSERLELSSAHVKGVVTFYTLFNQQPPGKHQVWVCRTLSCALRGSDAILEHCERRLGIHVGQARRRRRDRGGTRGGDGSRRLRRSFVIAAQQVATNDDETGEREIRGRDPHGRVSLQPRDRPGSVWLRQHTVDRVPTHTAPRLARGRQRRQRVCPSEM